MTTLIVPVILSGGSGTRLWPISRSSVPKQVVNFSNSYTMLQDTLIRLEGLGLTENPIIVCNNKYKFILTEQIREIKKKLYQ